MYKYHIIQYYPNSKEQPDYILTLYSRKKAKQWIKAEGNPKYKYKIKKVKYCKSNLILVPDWLDFEPVRTRYIEAVKAYRKLCGW